MGKQWISDRLYFLGFQNHSDGDCSHEIKRRFFLGRKAMTKLDIILKRRDIPLLTEVHLFKAVVFLIVMYGLELWHWRRLLRVPWTAGRSNQSILKEINSEYSLVGLMLKLKVKYFGHRMQRANSLEKILMLGKMRAKGEGGGRGCYCCIASLTHWI